MNRFIFNGKLLQAETCIAGPDNRGLRYGDGLFETLRCQHGEPLLADAHFSRLWKGINALGFDCPARFTPEQLQADIRKLLSANGHTRLARVRLQLFRAGGGLYDAATDAPQYFIESWELEPHTPAFNSNGLVLGLYSGAKKSCDDLANLKHCNYLPYIMAAKTAQQHRWNDALLLNSHERICESSIANLFIIRGATVLTPALSEGPVAGIMRQHLIQLLQESGMAAEETSLTPNDLLEADEIFLTNSIRPLRWVQSFGNRTYRNEKSAAIHALLAPTIG